MNIRKTLAMAAVAVIVSSTAFAQADQPPSAFDPYLKAFTQFVMYAKLCDVDPLTVVSKKTMDAVDRIALLRPEAERNRILAEANDEVTAEVTAAGLPKFCATYGAGMTPAIRKFDELMQSVVR